MVLPLRHQLREQLQRLTAPRRRGPTNRRARRIDRRGDIDPLTQRAAMTRDETTMTTTVRVNENETGRDFVIGDVHGEYDTLEAMLAELEFHPGRDRLFALGDLIDRGPRSADTLEWMEQGRITLTESC